jgi:uncharacterized membrane protein YbhN (UPF0104 family)
VTLLRRLARSFWARAVVSAALLALVLSQIDLSEAQDRLSEGSWWLFVAAVLTLLASFVAGALRWHIYLRAAAIDVAPAGAVRAYLIGTFTTNFLPSQVGGDVTRAWVASGRGTRLRALTTVVFDRATALACLIAVGWIAYATNTEAVPGQLVAALAAATAALAVVVAVAVVVFRGGWLARFVPTRLKSPGREVRAASIACASWPVLRRTLLIGLGFQGLVVLAAWLVARSLDLSIALAPLAVSLAPVLMVAVLPISIGGLGVRESAYVVLLGYAGLSSTDAALFSLVAAAAFALASLPGALALLKRPEAASRPAAQADDGEQERREEDLETGDDERDGEHREALLRQGAAEPAVEPPDHDHSA